MGLILAAAGAIGGNLGDQWLDAIEAQDMGEGVVFCKGAKLRSDDRRSHNRRGTTDVISNGSKIHVYDRQAMMLVDGGRITEFSAEPGLYTVDSSMVPSMFAGGLGASVKDAWERGRPSTTLLLGKPASSFSFPSGHSFNTAVFAGMLAGMVLTSTAVTLYRALAIMAAAGATLLVGASRVYLGYHWMTDVLAGWSLGLAWLCLVTLALLWLKGRRRPISIPAAGPSDSSSGVDGIEPPPA